MSETIVHELKTHPEYFRDVFSGSKTFEVRFDDRGFRVGDILLLREYDPGTEKYTGIEIRKEITYILRDFAGLNTGWVVMAIQTELPF